MSTPSASLSELETPTTTAYSLTEELEKSLAVEGGATHTPGQSLDLNSAVKGVRIVTAVEVSNKRSIQFQFRRASQEQEFYQLYGKMFQLPKISHWLTLLHVVVKRCNFHAPKIL